MGTILAIIIAILINALVIWIVSKLGLGLKVEGYTGAIVAAIVIALVTWVVVWLLGLIGINIGGGILGAIIGLIIAAIVLLLSDKILPGMSVAGFGGAIVAAIAIAVFSWLIWWLLGVLGLA
jgi:putative membrane protein